MRPLFQFACNIDFNFVMFHFVLALKMEFGKAFAHKFLHL